MDIFDETEVKRTVICRHRAYEVPKDVADTLDAIWNTAIERAAACVVPEKGPDTVKENILSLRRV